MIAVKFRLLAWYKPDAANPAAPDDPPRNHVLTFGPSGDGGNPNVQPTGSFEVSLPPDLTTDYTLGAEYAFTCQPA